MLYTAKQVKRLSNLGLEDIVEALNNSGYETKSNELWDEEFVGISDGGKSFVYQVWFESPDDGEDEQGYIHVTERVGKLYADY